MESKSLDATEARSAAHCTHPRVTLESMRAKIVLERYLTLGAAFDAIGLPTPLGPDDTCPLDVYTLCVLVLDNGWVVVGHSAPAAPENFDAEKGKQFAYEKAIAQLWPMEGYILRNDLYREATSARDTD